MRPTPTSRPRRPADGSAGGDPDRFAGIRRDYTPADVERLAGSLPRPPHAGRDGRARGCGICCKTEPFVPTLGALTGNQAVQQVKAGLKAIYLSGWQVAADANTAGQMYPDQSLYPVDFGAEGGAPDQQRAAPLPTRSRRMEGERRHLLDGADRRRRGGRLRRRAERLRADEGDDRGRRRRRAFRGPARVARRNAAISAARCWCRSASTSAR